MIVFSKTAIERLALAMAMLMACPASFIVAACEAVTSAAAPAFWTLARAASPAYERPQADDSAPMSLDPSGLFVAGGEEEENGFDGPSVDPSVVLSLYDAPPHVPVAIATTSCAECLDARHAVAQVLRLRC